MGVTYFSFLLLRALTSAAVGRWATTAALWACPKSAGPYSARRTTSEPWVYKKGVSIYQICRIFLSHFAMSMRPGTTFCALLEIYEIWHWSFRNMEQKMFFEQYVALLERYRSSPLKKNQTRFFSCSCSRGQAIPPPLVSRLKRMRRNCSSETLPRWRRAARIASESCIKKIWGGCICISLKTVRKYVEKPMIGPSCNRWCPEIHIRTWRVDLQQQSMIRTRCARNGLIRNCGLFMCSSGRD